MSVSPAFFEHLQGFTLAFLFRCDEIVQHMTMMMMMASRRGEDRTVLEDELQGSTSEEETLERRASDALLRLSEEAFLAQLEPYEYPCSSGWEEAVHGWARVSPLSCILLAERQKQKEKKERQKLKQKEADNSAPSSPDPVFPNADNTANISASCVTQDSSFQQPVPLSEVMGSLSISAVAEEQEDLTERTSPVYRETQKTTLNPFLEKEIEKGSPKGTPRLNRLTGTPKNSPRPGGTMVPIKNFTFFPPIESSQLSPQRGQGTCVMYAGNHRTRGTRADFNAHSPSLISSVQVSSPSRYRLPSVYSRRHMPHRTSFSVGLRHGTNAPGHMPPRGTGHVVRLH